MLSIRFMVLDIRSNLQFKSLSRKDARMPYAAAGISVGQVSFNMSNSATMMMI